jgi:MtN3 and saliva related transmembrane protein
MGNNLAITIPTIKFSIPILVAFMAPAIGAFQYFPQLYKTLTTKKARDLSIYMFLLTGISEFLWLIHGIFLRDLALIVSCGFGSMTNFGIALMCILYA